MMLFKWQISNTTRIYIPDLSQPLPVAAFIHGGGHMCGSITVYDNIVRKLAKTTNHIIVSQSTID